MESLKQFWSETLDIPGAQWIIAGFGLVTCILVAVYVVKGYRDMALGNDQEVTSYLEEFQKLRDEGKLDKEEYDRLKKNIPRDLLDGAASNPPKTTDEVGDPKFVELKENE